ncbi:F-box/LRR-repeat protein [Apostasia shenzhenica]|uniref:F-box/LRR-repeat protein n=1 Tax=Apostasia shenzhenica TaxID=1088818 RepID=A0A2I0ATY4_9ASPA|nr:F-box/LRR-repeat protein [Apostasia shenzhenica]
MLNLTNLRLEFIRLDDEDLEKFNGCFPFLQVVKLIGVGGLRKPKIVLSQLRACHWTVSNFPLSLSIYAPRLIELKLECVEPKSLILETPSLSQLDLKIKKPELVEAASFLCLKMVRMEISHLRGITELFQRCEAVTKLEFEVCNFSEKDDKLITLLEIFGAFPNLDDLELGPGAWTDLESSLLRRGFGFEIPCQWINLKKLTLKLPTADLDVRSLSFVLKLCIPSCEISVLFIRDSPGISNSKVIATCTTRFPKFNGKWGIWED